MKKSLIALAALSAFATVAQAQSSVTVYGIIDTGYNSRENTSNANVVTESKGISGSASSNVGEAASNRIGFRGTEDLGGGLKANFVVESGMGQNSAFTIGGRAFWVGLQDAKMGELRIGRQDTFARTVWLSNDQLAAANVAGNLAHSDAQGDASTTSHTNRSVAVNYFSPVMNGVQLSLGVTQDDTEASNANKTKNGSGAQVGLSYTAGKFAAGVAYVEATTATNLVAGSGYLFAPASSGTCATGYTEIGTTDVCYKANADTAAADTKVKDTAAGASYDLGVAKVAYIYNKREADNRLSTSTGDSERTSHAFSASIPLSAKLVGRVGYGFGEYRTGASTAYKGDLKGMQAALNYNLSKRTMVYGIYGDEKREDSATTQIKTKEYSVGVRHSF